MGGAEQDRGSSAGAPRVSRNADVSGSAGKAGISLHYPSARFNGPAFRLVTAEADQELPLDPVREAIWLAAEEALSADALIQRVRCSLGEDAPPPDHVVRDSLRGTMSITPAGKRSWRGVS